MKSYWIPVLVVRPNIFKILCLGLLSISPVFVENAADSLSTSDDRHQFPKQSKTAQNRHDNRHQFPTQRRGSGTHWQIQIPTLNT